MSTLRLTLDAFNHDLELAVTSLITNLCALPVQELSSGASALPRSPNRARAPAPGAPKAARKTGRLARRTPEDIAKVVAAVAALLRKGPLGAEAIRKALGVEPKELPRVFADGLKARVFTKSGQKRATLYSLGGASAEMSAKKAKATATMSAKKAKATAKKATKPAKKAAPKAKKATKPAKKAAPKAKKAAPKPKKAAPKKVAPPKAPSSKPALSPDPSAN